MMISVLKNFVNSRIKDVSYVTRRNNLWCAEAFHTFKSSFSPKVTTVMEWQNLTTMSMATLLGELRERELELGSLNEKMTKEGKKLGLQIWSYKE